MSISLSPSSGLRAAGTATAAFISPTAKRRILIKAAVLGLSDGVARRLGPVGITVVSITPDEGETFTPTKQALCDAVSTVGWVGAGLLVVTIADRVPLPRAVRALAVGAGVYIADVKAAELFAALMAKAKAAQPPADSN